LTINTLLNTKQYTTIPAGSQMWNGKNLTVIKLIPTDESLDWVISTLWIDPVDFLVYKTATTTKENGSYEILMQYGEYAKYGLASKIVFSFNTKDYKLPNGITLEFGDEDPASKQKLLKNKKGTIEITYNNYLINKGVPNSIF
jgi:outer membrane lipoprotein-sorting protein